MLLDSLETNIRALQTQIISLDTTIIDYSNIESEFMSTRATLLSQLANNFSQRNVQLAQNITLREPLLLACEQFNNLLPDNQTYEQNQILINNLHIKRARGINFTQQDIESLHSIAQQCVIDAGRTKESALSLLPPVEGRQQYWRENPDDYQCTQNRDNYKDDIYSTVSLFPNPATDILTVQFSLPTQGEIIITDIAGITLSTFSVKQSRNSVNIPVSGLGSGVYALYFMDSNGKLPAVSKFVISR